MRLQVHRLEAEVGGLLLIAKTRPAFQALSAALGAREVDKHFTALVGGRLQGRGRVDFPLDGRPAASEWQACNSLQSRRHGWVTTVVLRPLTGSKCRLMTVVQIYCYAAKSRLCYHMDAACQVNMHM